MIKVGVGQTRSWLKKWLEVGEAVAQEVGLLKHLSLRKIFWISLLQSRSLDFGGSPYLEVLNVLQSCPERRSGGFFFYTVLFNISIVPESYVIPKSLKFSNHCMFNKLLWLGECWFVSFQKFFMVISEHLNAFVARREQVTWEFILCLCLYLFKGNKRQIVVAQNVYKFISRMSKMCATPQLAEHFKRSHSQCEHSYMSRKTI